MNEYTILLLYIPLGCFGAYAHWFKKRHKDNTTEATLIEYITLNFNDTVMALGAMVFSEMALAVSSPAISLASIMAALTAGYTCDSILNKAPDA